MRELTLLFCDVRNFTSISEQLTAHELTQLHQQPADAAHRRSSSSNRGTIDKYMGDAIMAFWNAPLDDPDHAGNACRCGAARWSRADGRPQRRVASARRRQQGRKYVHVAIGIGINSGDCCVGNLGSSQRFDYSAIGDDVNVASRLEGLSKLYGVTDRHRRVDGGAGQGPALELDLIQVKGRTAPSRLYTMTAALGGSEESVARLLPLHAAMLAAYRDRAWERAEALIAECRALGVSTLAKLYDAYQSRIADWRESPPPPDWDGSFTATEK